MTTHIRPTRVLVMFLQALVIAWVLLYLGEDAGLRWVREAGGVVFDAGTIVEASQAAPATPGREIDASVWSVIAKTVVEDDIVGMGRLYSTEAVLVTPKGTTPIKQTLERWGKDMVAAKARGDRATVEFRFSLRQDDASTAFEAGLFQYTVITKAGVSTPQFIPFEALLVKTGGAWRILMERQFAPVTQAEWDKLPK